MRMTDFWPKEYWIGSAEIAEVVIEPCSGGRWFERGIDGSECLWGRVASWDPPREMVLLWQIVDLLSTDCPTASRERKKRL